MKNANIFERSQAESALQTELISHKLLPENRPASILGNRDRLDPVATEFAEINLAVPERREPFVTVLTKDGKPYSRSRHPVGRVIAALGRKAGIVVKAHQKTGETEFASAHDLRRSFGERWAKRVEAPFLQKMCGIR